MFKLIIIILLYPTIVGSRLLLRPYGLEFPSPSGNRDGKSVVEHSFSHNIAAFGEKTKAIVLFMFSRCFLTEKVSFNQFVTRNKSVRIKKSMVFHQSRNKQNGLFSEQANKTCHFQ